MKTCPFCAEEIQDAAVVCRHCGRDLASGALPGAAPYAAEAAAPTVQTRTNAMAIASLVLGIVWIYGVGSVLALVFGYKGKSEIDRSAGAQTGRGLAIAGIVLGWIGVTIIIVGFVLVVAVGFMGGAASSQFSSVGSAVNVP